MVIGRGEWRINVGKDVVDWNVDDQVFRDGDDALQRNEAPAQQQAGAYVLINYRPLN